MLFGVVRRQGAETKYLFVKYREIAWGASNLFIQKFDISLFGIWP